MRTASKLKTTGSMLYLLARTLAELALLPIHLAVFLVRRGRIRREIRRVLEQQR